MTNCMETENCIEGVSMQLDIEPQACPRREICLPEVEVEDCDGVVSTTEALPVAIEGIVNVKNCDPVIRHDVEWVCNSETDLYDKVIHTWIDGVAQPDVVITTAIKCEDEPPLDVELFEVQRCENGLLVIDIHEKITNADGTQVVGPDVIAAYPTGVECNQPDRQVIVECRDGYESIVTYEFDQQGQKIEIEATDTTTPCGARKCEFKQMCEADDKKLLLVDSEGSLAEYSFLTGAVTALSSAVASAGSGTDIDNYLSYAVVTGNELQTTDVNTQTVISSVPLFTNDGSPLSYSSGSYYNGFLYTYNYGGQGLHQIDVNTGEVSLVASGYTGVVSAGSSLAINPVDGKFYVMGANTVYEIDPTGANLVANPVFTSPTGANGATFDDEGNLYLGWTSGSTEASPEVLQVNLATGQTQAIVEDWAPGVNSLAFYRTLAQQPTCFKRKFCYDAEGNVVSTEDFELDEVTPRTIVGAAVCCDSIKEDSSAAAQIDFEAITECRDNVLYRIEITKVDGQETGRLEVDTGYDCDTEIEYTSSARCDSATGLQVVDVYESINGVLSNTPIATRQTGIECEAKDFEITNLCKLQDVTGELRSREWHDTFAVVQAVDYTTEFGRSVRETFDNTLTPDTEVTVASLSVNDLHDTSLVSTVQIVDGYIVVEPGNEGTYRFYGGSEGYIAILLGRCKGELELIAELGKGVGFDEINIQLPVGIHNIEIWNIDSGGSNSNWNADRLMVDGTYQNADNFLQYSEVCPSLVSTQIKLYEDGTATELLSGDVVNLQDFVECFDCETGCCSKPEKDGTCCLIENQKDVALDYAALSNGDTQTIETGCGSELSIGLEIIDVVNSIRVTAGANGFNSGGLTTDNSIVRFSYTFSEPVSLNWLGRSFGADEFVRFTSTPDTQSYTGNPIVDMGNNEYHNTNGSTAGVDEMRFGFNNVTSFEYELDITTTNGQFHTLQIQDLDIKTGDVEVDFVHDSCLSAKIDKLIDRVENSAKSLETYYCTVPQFDNQLNYKRWNTEGNAFDDPISNTGSGANSASNVSDGFTNTNSCGQFDHINTPDESGFVTVSELAESATVPSNDPDQKEVNGWLLLPASYLGQTITFSASATTQQADAIYAGASECGATLLFEVANVSGTDQSTRQGSITIDSSYDTLCDGRILVYYRHLGQDDFANSSLSTTVDGTQISAANFELSSYKPFDDYEANKIWVEYPNVPVLGDCCFWSKPCSLFDTSCL